jgi:hypothetical protein
MPFHADLYNQTSADLDPDASVHQPDYFSAVEPGAE